MYLESKVRAKIIILLLIHIQITDESKEAPKVSVGDIKACYYKGTGTNIFHKTLLDGLQASISIFKSSQKGLLTTKGKSHEIPLPFCRAAIVVGPERDGIQKKPSVRSPLKLEGKVQISIRQPAYIHIRYIHKCNQY